MSLILDGTNGVSDIDGTAGTPAIRGTDTNTGIFFGSDIIGFSEGGAEVARFNADAQFVAAAGTALLPVITTTGDVNTGMFFPAADTIAFSEGGAEAMRIDSSGNVGIGVTTVLTPNSRVTTLQVGTNAAGGSAELVLGHQGDGFSLFTSGGSGVGSVSVAQGTTSLAEYTYQGIFKFNSGYGSAATAYGCRAWVNFNGTGTVAIRGSGNVSSITDNGTGDYTVNFTTALVDANYSVAASGGPVGTTAATHVADLTVGGPGTGTAPTTTAVRVIGFSIPHNVGADVLYANVTIFR